MISRRGLIVGLGAILAAPAIVRVSSLMPIRGINLAAVDLSPPLAGLKIGDILRVMNTLRQNNIPTLPDGSYVVVADQLKVKRLDLRSQGIGCRVMANLA